VPDVDSIDGLPPAGRAAAAARLARRALVGRQRQHAFGAGAACSTRAPARIRRASDALRRGLLAEHAQGACPHCHGLGRVFEVSEAG
jgi:excinuclease UvrABC ATPase subunit